MSQCKFYLKSYVWPHDLQRHLKLKHPITEKGYTTHSNQQKESTMSIQQQLQQQQKFQFMHPFTANVSGPTSCGKTYFVKLLLQNCLTKFDPPPE